MAKQAELPKLTAPELAALRQALTTGEVESTLTFNVMAFVAGAPDSVLQQVVEGTYKP